MDRDLRLRVPHRRTARPADPPRQHPRDERRELSPRQQHCPKAATKVLRSDRSFWPKEANAPWHAPAIGKRARHGAGHCHLAWFCAAAWPDFAPPLTPLNPEQYCRVPSFFLKTKGDTIMRTLSKLAAAGTVLLFSGGFALAECVDPGATA